MGKYSLYLSAHKVQLFIKGADPLQPQTKHCGTLQCVMWLLYLSLPLTAARVFPGSMKMSSSDSYFYAAIVAVLAVHVVLALFVYVAWNEGTPKGKGKDD